MGMLERYKKTGGFVQLLSLLESCGPQKQEKFLSMIKEENSAWENALRQRILTVDKILSWPPEALAEVTSRCQILSLTGVYLSVDSKKQELIFKTCPFPVQKKVKDMIDEKKFTPAELSTTVEKFLAETRGLITQNILKMDKIDPAMEVVEGIEEKLNTYQIINHMAPAPSVEAQYNANLTSHLNAVSSSSTPSSNTNSHFNSAGISPNEEITILKMKIQQLQSEILELKQENSIYKDKLDRIKKIA